MGILKKLMLAIILVAIIGGAVWFFQTTGGTENIGIMERIARLVGFGSENNRVNAIVLGTDEGGTRTDVIIFVSYNPKNKKLNMISIPRDTRVPNSNDKKINSVFTKGKEDLVIKDIEYLLNLPVDYYGTINLSAFRRIVDEIGGIPMNVPIDMKYNDPAQNFSISIDKGYQVLNGEKAEGFVRYRSGYPTADLGRIEAQHEFLNAAIAQIKKPQNLAKIPSIIGIISKNVRTNMSTKDMLKYLGDLPKLSKDNIVMERLPGEPKYINGLSYFVNDKEETKKMTDRIFYNEDDIEDTAVIDRNSKYRVEVFNGTNIPGFGSKIADKLKQKGFNVVRVDNWDSSVKETKIYERNGKAEGAYAKNALKVGQVSSDYDKGSDVDLSVILGLDANQ